MILVVESLDGMYISFVQHLLTFCWFYLVVLLLVTSLGSEALDIALEPYCCVVGSGCTRFQGALLRRSCNYNIAILGFQYERVVGFHFTDLF